MTDLTNIFARSIKDLTLLPQLPDDLIVLDHVKVPVGNLPVGLNGCEALTVKQIKDIVSVDIESKVEVALSNLSTTANKFYPTLSEANSHLATMPVNTVVTIGEEAYKGLWYKATANATTLIKSAYDPLTQANNYTNNKTSITKTEVVAIANNYTDLVFDAVPAVIAPYVAQAEAAATAATISAGVFETPEAGVDPVTGVEEGEYFNVRSPSSDSYIDEYQNAGGSAIATGKSYLSALGVQQQEKPANTIKDASGKTQQEINNARVVVVDSIADLLALPEGQRKEGLRYLVKGYYTGSDIGGGEFYWDSSSEESDNRGTVLKVSGVALGRWKRPIRNGLVYLDWFGLDYTGSTEEQGTIQAAVDATPVGGTLEYPSREGTILIDIPAAQGVSRPRGVYFNKPMTIRGGRQMTTKVKDFCSAWLNYTTVMSAYQIESSGVTIDGLRVDANADNHYEIDGSGFKWWENGPKLKRPPNGISIVASDLMPNISDCVVENCIVYRPLSGILANGAFAYEMSEGMDSAAFLKGTLKTNTVVNPIFRNNIVYRARGNDYLFQGVRGGKIHNNHSVDSQYHVVRFYNTCVDCHMYANTAYVDYARMGALYNETDLGFWRTTNTASSHYLIARSGYCIGSSWVNQIGNKGNVQACSMTENTIHYASNNPSTTILNREEATMASFQTMRVVKDITVSRNKSYNSPTHGLFGIIQYAEVNNYAEGLTFKDNEIYSANGRGLWLQGDYIEAANNLFLNCASSSTEVVLLKGWWQKVYQNRITWNMGLGHNTRNVFYIYLPERGGDIFVSDNIVSGYSGQRVGASVGVVCHGTDKGVELELLNGWVNTQDGTPSLRNRLKVYVDVAGRARIEGLIRGVDATANIVAQLPSVYTVRNNSYVHAVEASGDTIGKSYVARVTGGANWPSSSSVRVLRGADVISSLFIGGELSIEFRMPPFPS